MGMNDQTWQPGDPIYPVPAPVTLVPPPTVSLENALNWTGARWQPGDPEPLRIRTVKR